MPAAACVSPLRPAHGEQRHGSVCDTFFLATDLAQIAILFERFETDSLAFRSKITSSIFYHFFALIVSTEAAAWSFL